MVKVSIFWKSTGDTRMLPDVVMVTWPRSFSMIDISMSSDSSLTSSSRLSRLSLAFLLPVISTAPISRLRLKIFSESSLILLTRWLISSRLSLTHQTGSSCASVNGYVCQV